MRKSPGDFFELEGGFAILQHASDYSLVTQTNPARPEEVLIAYLTGMPGSRPVVPTGVPSPGNPAAIVPPSLQAAIDSYNIVLQLGVSPQFGGNDITTSPPSFIGLVPGLVGVYQINFKLSEQSILFVNRQSLAPFSTEFHLSRRYCSSGSTLFCSPTTDPRFLSKRVRIPIAPKE